MKTFADRFAMVVGACLDNRISNGKKFAALLALSSSFPVSLILTIILVSASITTLPLLSLWGRPASLASPLTFERWAIVVRVDVRYLVA